MAGLSCLLVLPRLTSTQTFDLYDSALSAWPSSSDSQTLSNNLGAVDIVEKENEFLIVADTPGELAVFAVRCG